MFKLWLYFILSFVAAYFYLTWVPTYQYMAQSDPNRANVSNQSYIYSPLEQGLYIQDTHLPLSPFLPKSPEKTITIVGGGLAGLTTAIEAVDQYYNRFESLFKFFASNLKAKDYGDILIELQQLSSDDIDSIFKSNDIIFDFITHIANFKIFILDKEEKIGGNSMKASSGINAVGTSQQKDWFMYSGKTNPDDVNKHPDLYTDSSKSFLFDTLKSSISPEPPIWEPLDQSTTTHTASNDQPEQHKEQKATTTTTTPTQFDTTELLLSPLSPFTPDLIKTVVNRSHEAITFLEKSQLFPFVGKLSNFLLKNYYPSKLTHSIPEGQSQRHIIEPSKQFQLFLTKFAQLGGHQHPRTHRPGPETFGEPMKGPELPIGAASITSLSTRIGQFPYNLHISVITSAQLIGLTYPSKETVEIQGKQPTRENYGIDSGIVNGLIYKVLPKYNNIHNLQQHNTDQDIGKLFILPANHVVLATGGYSAGQSLLEQYAPNIAKMDLPTTNGPWATGDSIDIGIAAGGAVVGMDMVQIHPTSFVVPTAPNAKVNFLAPEALRGVGGVLINLNGKRFVNELTTRDVASRAIYWQPYKMSYLVLSAECAKEFGGAINFYASKGIFAKTAKFDTNAIVENELLLSKRLGTVLGNDIDKGMLINFVNNFVKNKSNVDSPTKDNTKADINIFGIPTQPITFNIIEFGLTMLQLTSTVKQKAVFSMESDLFPLLTNVYTEMTDYSQFRDQIDDKRFKRPFINHPTTFAFNSEQYFIAIITPAIHFTMGGLAIDTNARVVRHNSFNDKKRQWEQKLITTTNNISSTTQLIDQFIEQPIDFTPAAVVKGLYAVGEASGGLHGRNRLGGNSLLECVMMGKQAAHTIVNFEMLPDF